MKIADILAMVVYVNKCSKSMILILLNSCTIQRESCVHLKVHTGKTRYRKRSMKYIRIFTNENKLKKYKNYNFQTV